MNKLSTARITKSLSIAAATLLLATPFASQAHDYDAAMDACIDAFIASVNLPKEQPVTRRKEEVATSPIAVHTRAYEIVVTAKSAESGKNLGRGTCLVDRSGSVIALNGKPLTAKLAAR